MEIDIVGIAQQKGIKGIKMSVTEFWRGLVNYSEVADKSRRPDTA